MSFFDRQNLPLTGDEIRAATLSAATTLRDVSFLRGAPGPVRIGCRAAMRQHALEWRRQSPAALLARAL